MANKIKKWLTTRRLNRLESDLIVLGARKNNVIRFNPRGAFTDALSGSDGYTSRIEEYRVWYTGNSVNLRDFYRSHYTAIDKINYFWRKAPSGVRMCHTGIPGLISRKMATILFGSGYKVTTTVYQDKNNKMDDELTAKAQELINNLIVLCDVDEKLESAAQNESWSGHIFLKFSHNVNLTPYPILEVATVRDAEVVKERGITTAIIFHYYYKDKNTKEYRLDETYTTNPVGDACILYNLYRLESNKEVEVELTTLSQTADLKDFNYTGLKGMLAFDKPNINPSHEFPDSPYGASDYEGGLDSLDALDEVYSGIVQELRDNKTIRYIPDSMIPKSEDGESVLSDEFITNYVKVRGDPDQDAKDRIDTTFMEDKTEDHLRKYRTYLTAVINNAGLSPFALGITGLESINSSAESQQERNKATLETRAKKLKLWGPFLEDVFTQMLIMNSWMQKNTTTIQDAFAKVDLDFNNLKLDIEFNDYIIDSAEKKISTWGSAKSQKVSSTYEAVRRIHPEWDDEHVNNEVNLIRYEEGMSLDNPDNLPGLDNIVNTDDDEDENTKKKNEDNDDSRKGE